MSRKAVLLLTEKIEQVEAGLTELAESEPRGEFLPDFIERMKPTIRKILKLGYSYEEVAARVQELSGCEIKVSSLKRYLQTKPRRSKSSRAKRRARSESSHVSASKDPSATKSVDRSVADQEKVGEAPALAEAEEQVVTSDPQSSMTEQPFRAVNTDERGFQMMRSLDEL